MFNVASLRYPRLCFSSSLLGLGVMCRAGSRLGWSKVRFGSGDACFTLVMCLWSYCLALWLISMSSRPRGMLCRLCGLLCSMVFVLGSLLNMETKFWIFLIKFFHFYLLHAGLESIFHWCLHRIYIYYSPQTGLDIFLTKPSTFDLGSINWIYNPKNPISTASTNVVIHASMCYTYQPLEASCRNPQTPHWSGHKHWPTEPQGQQLPNIYTNIYYANIRTLKSVQKVYRTRLR